MENEVTNDQPTAAEITGAAPKPEELLAAGEQMAQLTVFFEFHTNRPGFVKGIPAATFIRKIKEAGEENLTEEQEQQLAAYKATIVQTKEGEGENAKTTDTTMLHVSQDIMDRKEVSRIMNHDDKMSMWLKSISIPAPIRFRGAYLISHKRVEEVEEKMEEYLAQRLVLIQAFKAKYAELKEQAKTRRWPFYDEADYPNWEVIESQYGVEFNWISFNVPAALEKINNEIYQKAKAKAKMQWADAVEKAREVQRAALLALQQSFIEMLTPDDADGGKKKKFKPTAVKKLKEFLTTFEEMNLTGDLELAKIVKMTEDAMEGIEVDALRKDVDLRETMVKKMAEVKEHAAALVTVKERKVVFEDEEEPAAAPLPEEDALSLSEEDDQKAQGLMDEAKNLQASGGGTQEQVDDWYKKTEDFLGVKVIK